MHGGVCYTAFNGSLNRKLLGYWGIKNSGNFPAIQIYNKIEFKLKFMEGTDNIFCNGIDKNILSLSLRD